MGKTKPALSASWEQALAGEAGGKAKALAHLMQAEIGRVPPFLALLPLAYTVSAQQQAPSKRSNPSGKPLALNESPVQVSTEVQTLIAQALPNLGQGLFAVRASPLETPESQEQSAPTELPSYLNVWPKDVPDRVRAIWQASSLHDPQHQAQLGILIMPMIQAKVSGVAYSADPKTGERGQMVIVAQKGIHHTSPDHPQDIHAQQTYRISDKVIYERKNDDESPLLTEAQIREVAGLAQACAAHFGQPQQIEWAIDDTGLWLLQSGKIRQIISSDLYLNDPETIWDNHLAAEYYGGAVSPLTYSFVRRTQLQAYRAWLRGLHLSDDKQRLLSVALEQMLGYYKGRIYDNLSGWPTLLSVLPAPVSGATERHIQTLSGWALFPTMHGTLQLGEVEKLRQWQGRFGGQREAFEKRLKRALQAPTPPLHERSLQGLAAYYRELEAEILEHWDAPLLNDALCLMQYDLLRHLCGQWLHDETGNLHHDLLSHTGGLLRSESLVRLASVAQTVPQECLAVLENGTMAEIDMVLPDLAQQAMRAYLHDFGDYSGDLRLESLPAEADLLGLWRAVARQVRYGMPQHAGSERKESAEELALRRVKPLQRPLFTWVLKHLRESLRHKSNFYAERLRLVARVRLLLRECGKRLTETGTLAHPDDIFLLQIEEVLGLAEGSSATEQLRPLIEQRRAEHLRHQKEARPPSRFMVRGSFYLARIQPLDPEFGHEQAHSSRTGQGVVSGKVHGMVRVMHQTHTPLGEPSIVVMRRFHAQWLLLYPMIRAIIVEEANPLAEGVLMARELGIPLIIGLPEASTWLRDGDMIELDSQTGVVTKQNRRIEIKSGQWQESMAEWVDMER